MEFYRIFILTSRESSYPSIGLIGRYQTILREIWSDPYITPKNLARLHRSSDAVVHETSMKIGDAA